MFRIGLLLLSGVLDLLLLRPLLIDTALAPRQTLRAYYEPSEDGTALMLDEQSNGYMTDIRLDEHGDLEIPSGRTIAIPLRYGSEVTVRTLAADLAPYVVLGSKVPAANSVGAARLGDAVALVARGGVLKPRPWDASRSWVEDKEWLRRLHALCGVGSKAGVSIRSGPQAMSVRAGSCAGKIRVAADSPPTSLLVVVTGMHAAVVSSAGPSWRETRQVRWWLIAMALVRLSLLAFAVGAGPTALVSGALFMAGRLSLPEAILSWGATLPIAMAAAAARLIAGLFPRRVSLAWASGAVVLALEVGAIAAAVALLDVGTFGKEHVTREGDDACAVVGYSTVRGDSLRQGTAGLVEQLGDQCPRCRGRTSRFSREAQTLRWIRETVCSPSFPTPPGGEVIFVGGGNDDLFYRPARLTQRLGDFVSVLRFSLQPAGAVEYKAIFEHASQRVLATLDEQTADVESIARCASRGGTRFRFVHDFLIWDLDGGRSPARQEMLERRRSAVLAAGGDFVDLLAEFGHSAGVSWLNDFIHPSAVGQRMIADLLCMRLEGKPHPSGGRLQPEVSNLGGSICQFPKGRLKAGGSGAAACRGRAGPGQLHRLLEHSSPRHRVG
jgi:hypothetical protein